MKFDIGSPPRVRGKLANLDKSYNTFRITPACAGKTLTITINNNLLKDHPRVCGENRYAVFASCKT